MSTQTRLTLSSVLVMATMAVITRTEESVNLVWVLIASELGGDQQELSGGMAPFQSAMGFGRLGERIHAVHANPQLAGCDPAQHVARAPQEFLAGRQMVRQARPGEEERTLGVQDVGIEGRNRAAGLPEKRQHAAGAQRAQTLGKGGGAHRVVHHVDAASTGEPAYFGLEILVRVKDDFIGAGLSGNLRLGFGGDGAKDARADEIVFYTH